jgi:hypothetical protein
MLRRVACSSSLGWLQQATAAAAACTCEGSARAAATAAFATKAAKGSTGSAKASEALIPTKDWQAVKLPPQTAAGVPVTTYPGQAFEGDLRCVFVRVLTT